MKKRSQPVPVTPDDLDEVLDEIAARAYVRRTYPQAYTHPLGRAYAPGFWVSSGTGFTLAAGRTEAEAWSASAKLLHGLQDRNATWEKDDVESWKRSA